MAVAAFFLLRSKASDLPVIGGLVDEVECPLSGRKPAQDALVDRPAVAVKVENNAVAYPLSGLERAEVVYEEPVEGGLTRFMAIYHCTDARKIGPVRSSRAIDPAIMRPYTLILAAAGGNDIVRDVLTDAGVVLIDEGAAGDAMMRVARPGISMEHTLYAKSAALRKAGRKGYDDPPVDDIFTFGELEGRSRRARTIDITFSAGTSVSYRWDGNVWLRFDNDAASSTEAGDQLSADNVLIEQHTVNFSDVGDVLGARSPEIEDVTGSGKAVLFRDGRAIPGRWVRDALDDPVRFETRAGDEMVLAPGRTWIALVPDEKGDVKGSFSYER